VAVSDGTSTVRRQVLLNVLEGNQPPVLDDVHSRLPVVLTLPDSTVELRGGAMDLEGDKVSFRWSLVSEPAGSAVRLESPGEAKCKVTSITKPGSLVLKLEASDGTSTVAEELTVPVHPVNAAPVIDAAQATLATLAPSDGTTLLSATTRDPDGDCISHWWRVKACPPGARPVFAVQSGRDTKVSGLTVEGAYEFELTVVDRTKSATRKVVVTVVAKRGTLGH